MTASATIIWDWNGTLLNDVEYSIQTMNSLLSERGLDLIDYEKYRQWFEFPVIKYYQKLGFDFTRESFEEVGLEFMKRYFAGMDSIKLYDQAESSLRWFRSIGCRQMILSSMEQEMLGKMLKNLNILDFFEHVVGIDNHYGGGKIEAAHKLHAMLNPKDNRVLLIGDTLHDAEIGQQMGYQVVLVSHGHQDHQVLRKANVPVMGDLAELVGWFYTSTFK
ncbi:MAG: HAD family hydrolase [Bacteroidales bacterium]|jgi:phosphoglycolate phosphatase|nr:HAD family hydrolase [Bacteroidales bacterium]